MPLTDDMQLVSIDDHLIEMPDVWQSRLPAKYRESGPRVIEAEGTETDQYGFGNKVPKGSQAWMLEGKVYAQLGLNAVAGKPREQIGTDPLRFSDMIPGCYDPAERVKDMDIDGVQTGMLFPSFPRFSGSMFMKVQDQTLADLCVRAWNDCLLDEWCDPYPGRFIPMAILPFWDIDRALAELDRLQDRGIRSLSLPESPVPLGLPSFYTDHWDRLFDVVEEREIVLSLHFGTSGSVPFTAPEAPMATMTTLMGTNSMAAVTDLLFSSVFDRHPRLKVSIAEGGVGWIPWLLERADSTWERHRFYQNVRQDRRPSEVFVEHIFGCFILDDYGVANRHRIGVENMLWECDYPHSDSFWPHSRKIVSDLMANVPDDETRKIVEENARRLFRFPRVS